MNLIGWPRGLLRAWAKSGVAPGLCYGFVERYGPKLSSKRLLAEIPGGARVDCDLRDHVQRQIYFWGAYEVVEAFVFGALVKPGMTFVDGGANVGQYSLLAAALSGPGGAVAAFEPVAANFALLNDNVERSGFKTIRPVNLALWHRNERLKMGRGDEHQDNAGTYRVFQDQAVNGFEAEAVRFDDWFKSSGLKKVDMIKLDVEGAELFALEGTRDTLTRFHPHVLIEMQNDTTAGFGYSGQAIFDFFMELGYKCWQISDSPANRKWISRGETWTAHNLLFTTGDLPAVLTTPWTWKSAIHWARRTAAGFGSR